MDYIKVGKILNTHGIKGEIKVYPLTDDVKRFERLKEVYIEEKLKVEIQKVWYKKKFVILKFKQFNNINEVIPFKNKYLSIKEEDVIELPEYSYFIYQIVGCKVFDMKKNKIGLITEVINTCSNDVYVVKDDENSKEYLIPAVKKFVKKVDIDKKVIIIDPIEGMIE